MRDVHSATIVSLKRHQNTFGMVTPSRTYYLEAGTSEECHAWVKALNEVRIRLKEEDATPGAGTPRVASLSNLPSVSTSPPNAVPAAKRSSISSANRAAPPPSIITSPAPIPQGKSSTIGQMPRTPISPMALSSDEDDPFTATIPHPLPTPTSDSPPRAGVTIAPTALPTHPSHPNSPPKGPPQVILSGYLMKCGSKRKTWRKRWFMLTSDRLAYSKSHIDTKHTKHVTLDQFVDAIEYEPLPKHNRHSPEASGASAGSMPISMSLGQSPSAGSSHHGVSGGGGGSLTVGGPSSLEKNLGAGLGGQPSSYGATSLASESGTSTFGGSSAFSAASHSTATGLAGGGSVPKNTFKIITTQRPFLLSAPSEEEEIQWLSAVRALIARRS